MIKVQLIGGPKDGEFISLTDYSPEIYFPVLLKIDWTADTSPIAESNVGKITYRVQLDRLGYPSRDDNGWYRYEYVK